MKLNIEDQAVNDGQFFDFLCDRIVAARLLCFIHRHMFSFVFTLSTVLSQDVSLLVRLRGSVTFFMLYRQLYRSASFTVLKAVYTMWYSRIPREKVFMLSLLYFRDLRATPKLAQVLQQFTLDAFIDSI